MDQKHIESAYKRAVAVRRAEAAVVRAAVRLRRARSNMRNEVLGRRPMWHGSPMGTVTAAHLVDVAVDKLLKARKEARR